MAALSKPVIVSGLDAMIIESAAMDAKVAIRIGLPLAG